jgi:hypothetical protein
MTEDEEYVSELLVVEAVHKFEQEGAAGVMIQMLKSGLEQLLHSELEIFTPYSNHRNKSSKCNKSLDYYNFNPGMPIPKNYPMHLPVGSNSCC